MTIRVFYVVGGELRSDEYRNVPNPGVNFNPAIGVMMVGNTAGSAAQAVYPLSSIVRAELEDSGIVGATAVPNVVPFGPKGA